MKLRHGAFALSFFVCFGLVFAAYAQKSGGNFFTGKSQQSGKTKPKIDDAQLIRARANWFYRQRAYPLGHIPAFARERAWAEFRQQQEQQRRYFLQKYGSSYPRQLAALSVTTLAPTVANPWTPIGPQPTNAFFNHPDVSGRVSALVVDPCDTTGNTVFLGGAQGGLWKTTDGGQHWTPLTDLAASLAVGSLAVPPNSCLSSPPTTTTIYVGTGEENFSFDSYYGAGVLTCKTADGASYTCTADTTLGAFNATTNPLTDTTGGAFIGGLAVDPQNPSILLAAVQGYQSTLPSGIWCSANGGSTWTHYVPPTGVLGEVGTAVAFDAAGFGYGAIGNIDGSGSLNGIYKTSTPFTTDCTPGSTFSALSGLASAAGGVSAMGRISFSVFSTSTTSAANDEIFAAVASALPASDPSGTLLGVFGSGNGGSTWTQMSDPLLSSGGYCQDQCFYDLPIVIDPYNPAVVYAGGSAPSAGATIIANTNAATVSGGTITINGSSAWTDVSDNSCTNCLTGVHVDAHAIAFARNGTSGGATKVYVGTDGGTWSATSPESLSSFSTWADLNATLGLTQIYSGMSNNPSGWQYRTYLGAQDNGTQVLAPDLTDPSGGPLPPAAGPWAWNDTLSCGDGGVTLVDPLIPSTVYGECAYIPGVLLGIEKSLFNGNADDSNDSSGGDSTFFEASSGINSNDNGNFIPPFAIDPQQTGSTGDADTLYFGTYRVWQTTDGANTWNAISADVTGADPSTDSNSAVTNFCTSNPGSCVLTALAVAPTNSNEVVTGSDVGQVYVTVNASQGSNAAWANVTGVGMLPMRDITQVAFDPAIANTLYATFSGFSGFKGDTKGHVFIGTLTPTGTPVVAWTDISAGLSCPTGSGNLPNIPVNDIVIDPSVTGTLYVGTDVGVYMGTLQGTPPAVTGACWQPLGTGLPNSAVLSLTMNAASRTLIAGTHGRSAWAYSLGGIPAFALTSLSPTSANAGSGSAFTMTLGGNGFTANSTVNWTPSSGSPTTLSQVSSPPAGCAVPACIAVSVPASLVASSGIVNVSVSDPSETSSTNSLKFTVTAPLPVVNSISPVTGGVGSAIPLTLTGTGFIPSTTVGLQTELGIFPCSPLAQASGGSSTQISTTIPATCLQANTTSGSVPYGGVFFVTANSAPPGGGSSNPNLIAAAATYGNSCTSSLIPGCLLTVTGTTPSNATFAGATKVTSNTFSVTEDTSGANPNASGPNLLSLPCIASEISAGSAPPPDNGDAMAVWFSYTPSSAATAEIDTIGSDYDTILSVWTGSQGTLSPVPNGCNDDIVSGVDRVSQVSNLSLSAGTTYYILVSTFGIPILNGSGTAVVQTVADGGLLRFNMNVSTAPPPSFTASASGLSPTSVTAGSSATFTVTVNGSSTSPTGTVTLGPCTSSPTTTTITCTYSPGTLSVGPSSSATSTVTISTTSRGAIPPAAPFQSPPLGWIVVVLAAFSTLAFFLRRRAAGGQLATVRSRLAAALGFALLASLLAFSVACGGGGGSPSTPTGTPAGTYTITVPISPAPSNGNASVQLTVQ